MLTAGGRPRPIRGRGGRDPPRAGSPGDAEGRPAISGPDRVLDRPAETRVESYPNHVWFYFNLVDGCLAQSPPLRVEALRYASAAATIRPDSVVFRVKLADSLGQLGATRESIAALREAIRLEPKYALAQRPGPRPEQREGLRRGGRRLPRGHTPRTELRTLSLQSGRLTARQEGPRGGGRRLARGHPPRTDGRLRAQRPGPLLYDLKDFDGAAAAYREATRLEPNYAPSHSNLGVSLHAKKDLVGAAAALREAIRLEPTAAFAQRPGPRPVRPEGTPTGRPPPSANRPSASTRTLPWLTPTWETRCAREEGVRRGGSRLRSGRPPRPQIGPRPINLGLALRDAKDYGRGGRRLRQSRQPLPEEPRRAQQSAPRAAWQEGLPGGGRRLQGDSASTPRTPTLARISPGRGACGSWISD